MEIVSIINKKRLGKSLTKEELSFAFDGYLKKSVPDYQMSALLMAICIKGMSDEEVFALTEIFLKSGDILDLSLINGVKVDKHSTGGVGDKTTLIIGPLVASCGVKVPKMSGRGLGHTGGTIDKLESIKGFVTELTEKEFINQVNTIGFAVTSQTANLTPLDKMVYALRDVTATVESLPLIAVSIMSKKLAGGADKILIDVKKGKGALIKTEEDALKISELMKKIGAYHNKEVETMITDMDVPLGRCIGNSLEVMEAIQVLENNGEDDLTSLCVELASNMVKLGKGISYEEAKDLVLAALHSRQAFKLFLDFVKAQHGDITKLDVSPNTISIISSKSGRVKSIDALKMGELSVRLGAGRLSKEDIIDPTVGIIIEKMVGENVEKGEVLCTLFVKEDYQVSSSEVENYFVIE